MADPIPNIRFNVAKSLEVISETLGNAPEGSVVAKERIVPAVENLKNDADADVRYFANRALQQALRTASQGQKIFCGHFVLLLSYSSCFPTEAAA